jgi:hypothetical protein
MKLVSKITEALPGAGRILIWVLPVWFFLFWLIAGRTPFEGPMDMIFWWFYICGLVMYVTRNRRDGGASQTLEEKGWYIRGGVLRRR